jgi:hypothetical protein
MNTKVQVKDLKKGDDLGNCLIVGDPSYYGNYCGQKDRMLVPVQYGNQEPKTAMWGRNTTVTVINR